MCAHVHALCVLYVEFHLVDCNFILLLVQFAAKQLDRNAKKCEKEEKTDKLKLKKVCYSCVLWSVCGIVTVHLDQLILYCCSESKNL